MNLLNKINKKSFYQQNVPLLFGESNDMANNHFAIISDGKYRFKIAWHSDIEPVIKEVILGVFGVGIDQHFSVIDFNNGNILLRLNLFYNFYDIEIFKNYILVILELEIIKINISDLKVVETYTLPDYFESIEFNEGIVVVKCVGDEVVNIE